MNIQTKIYCKQKSNLVVNIQNRLIFLPYFVGKIKDSFLGSNKYDVYYFGWLFFFFELKIYKGKYNQLDN